MKGNRLYLHVFSWPFRHLHLPGLAESVEFPRFLHDGSEVERKVIEPSGKWRTTSPSVGCRPGP